VMYFLHGGTTGIEPVDSYPVKITHSGTPSRGAGRISPARADRECRPSRPPRLKWGQEYLAETRA